MFQVIDSGYFAGSVPGQCQLEFVCRDAGAVIGDADKLQSAIHKIDANLRSSCVDAILDQFFDDGGGSLYDFSCSNLGGDIGRELTYWHSEYSRRWVGKNASLYILRTSVHRRL